MVIGKFTGDVKLMWTAWLEFSLLLMLLKKTLVLMNAKDHHHYKYEFQMLPLTPKSLDHCIDMVTIHNEPLIHYRLHPHSPHHTPTLHSSLAHRWNKIFVYILTIKNIFNLQDPPKIFQNNFSLSIHIPILDLYWKFFNDSIDVVCNWNFIELSRIRLHICRHPIYLTSLTWRPGGKDCFNFSAFSLSKTTSV